jgi:hypothetical protein
MGRVNEFVLESRRMTMHEVANMFELLVSSEHTERQYEYARKLLPNMCPVCSICA